MSRVRFASAWPIGCAALVIAIVIGSSDVLRTQPPLPPAAKKKPPVRRPLAPGDVETTASRVFIHVDKTGFGHQHAVAGRLKEGRLHIAENSAGELVFDMSSLVADTNEARRYVGLEGTTDIDTQNQVTTNMIGADVLDVEKYPTATFTVTAFRSLNKTSSTGKPLYQLEGEFTLHGAKRPLKILTDVSEERGYLHLQGNFPLKQTEYGIRPFKKALGTVGVADTLTVYGEIWVRK